MSSNTTRTYSLTPDTAIVRILNGMWQVSGAHGAIDPKAALKMMLDYYDDGFYTWDLADHYGPAEDLIGLYRDLLREMRGDAALDNIQAFTKWVPRPGPMSRATVEKAIDISRSRMKTERLDMLQFHWWDYDHPAYLDAMKHMADLQTEGKIRHLALTNFDTEHTASIVDSGVTLVSNQVQYSIIDQRPQIKMAPYCAANNISLLTYGTLCGGLLTDRYLDQPEPSRAQLTTASLRKYKQMIDAWGGWALFQELLTALRAIADKHEVSIANVAVRWVLDQPAVAGVIAGVRLGLSDNRADNARAFDLALDEADSAAIEAVTSRSRDLFRRIGDCGDEYRGAW